MQGVLALVLLIEAHVCDWPVKRPILGIFLFIAKRYACSEVHLASLRLHIVTPSVDYIFICPYFPGLADWSSILLLLVYLDDLSLPMDPATMEKLLEGPGLKPPPGILPNFVDPPSQFERNIAVNSLCLIIATICVFIRAYTRICIMRSYGWEDCKKHGSSSLIWLTFDRYLLHCVCEHEIEAGSDPS